MEDSKLIGHKDVYAYFQGLNHERLPSHAFLLCGPQQVGKKHLARILIKEWLCMGGQTDSLFGDAAQNTRKPCNTCQSCRAIEQGGHPDAARLERDPAKHQISVEQMREIISWAHRSGSWAETKYLIVDNAHELSIGAANAFLKTLEEPSGSAVFFLVTHQPDVLPQTIVSRCQNLSFQLIQEDEQIEDQRAWRMSGGRPGRYRHFQQDAKAVERHEKERALFDELLRSSKGERLRLLEPLFKKKGNHAEQKEEWQYRLWLWQAFLREELMAQLLRNVSQAQRSNTAIVRAIDKLAETRKNMTYYINLRAHLEQIMLMF